MATPLSGTVTGRFEDTATGSSDPITGTVYFTPETDYLLSADATVLPSPVTATVVNSAFTIDLRATDDPDLSPIDWTYRVTFDLNVNNGFRIKRDPFSIKVPADQITDLATVTPVTPSTGTTITRGAQGDKGDKGDTGIRGSKWFVSNGVTPDYYNVTGMIDGDIFLYPTSQDFFQYNGSEWVYSGHLGA